MKTQFDVLKKSRDLVVKEIKDLSLEQLDQIPNGFKNNISWNLAHLVVTQQLLHYQLSGLNCLISDDLIKKYRKGTLPSETISKEKLESFKEYLISLPEKLEEDYNAQIFNNYTQYPTSTGFVLDTIETAIVFNNFHEGLHYGIIRALKKLV